MRKDARKQWRLQQVSVWLRQQKMMFSIFWVFLTQKIVCVQRLSVRFNVGWGQDFFLGRWISRMQLKPGFSGLLWRHRLSNVWIRMCPVGLDVFLELVWDYLRSAKTTKKMNKNENPASPTWLGQDRLAGQKSKRGLECGLGASSAGINTSNPHRCRIHL